MDLLPLIPDNISEVLVKIIAFAGLRRSILHRNIRNLATSSYVPEDLPVLEFAEVLNSAISEHLQNHRLLFQDTPHIEFGRNGAMRVHPVIDDYAKTLLETNPDEYVELQVSRLQENSLNCRVAEELMRQNSGVIGDVPRLGLNEVMAGDTFPDDLPSQLDSTD